jgi:hypothetical protein
VSMVGPHSFLCGVRDDIPSTWTQVRLLWRAYCHSGDCSGGAVHMSTTASALRHAPPMNSPFIETDGC